MKEEPNTTTTGDSTSKKTEKVEKTKPFGADSSDSESDEEVRANI